MYTALTLLQLRADLQARWEDVPFWTDEEARLALNEALREWNLLTGFWKRRVTIATPQNNPWISLPATLVYNVRVEFDSFPLELSSLFDLDHGRPHWQLETTGDGGDVPTRPILWAPAGLTLITIWPADGEGDHSLVVDGVRATPILVNNWDKVDLGQVELDAVLGYALHYAAFKPAGSLARFQQTFPLYQQFLAAAADQNTRLKASAAFRRIMGLDVGRLQQPIRTPMLSPITTSGG